MNFFKNNFVLKLIALLSAIILWIFVVNEGFRVDYLEKEIPIKVYNLREDLALASDLGKVKLKVRAPQNLWQKLPQDNIEAYVDLKTFDPGIYDVEVKVSSQDPQVQVLEKDPDKVRIILEFKTSIKKEVSVKTKGNLGTGFYPGVAVVSPNEIEIKGAKSVLDNIDRAEAEVEFNGESSEIEKNVGVKVLDKDGNPINNISFSPENVKVTIPVLRENESKSVSVKAITSGRLPNNLSLEGIEITPSVINIFGKKDLISNIDYVETKEINLLDFKDTQEKEISLNLPRGVERIEPQTVKVKIIVSGQTITQNFEAPINFKNLNNKLKINSYNPQTVTLVLEGSKNDLDALSGKSVSINLNLQGKTAGTYNFTITKDLISLPDRIDIKSIETKEVKVNILEK